MQMKILSVLCKLESPYFNSAVDSHTTAASWAFSGLLGGSLQRLLMLSLKHLRDGVTPH